uniref:Zinc finger CCCH domain-containing protein 7A-like isoform X2 n=1 Tax=Crassostrea virginica TaxID=6565 RepID=A0A8B8CDS2_CRAVI|nr:zinc finger CCCH domain-containing protein 7A-like isoform X2 [Crassostrea virginica]
MINEKIIQLAAEPGTSKKSDTGSGPHRMMHPLNTRTSQAQIRPNMMGAPAPRPVADFTQYDEPAADFMNVRKTKLVDPGPSFNRVFAPRVDVSEPVKKNQQSMGLDCFSPPAGKSPSKLDFPPTTLNISSSASPLSSRTSSPSVKGLNQSTINEVKKIKFPLDDNYDWKLACRQCFVKLGEGIRGFRHHTNLTHECGKNILLVKLRKDGMNWMKVRPRPESKFQQFGSYKICTHFSNGNPCFVGEEKCTFAHNLAEKVLWNYDREESWLLMEFLAKLHQYKIDNNEELARIQAMDSSGDKSSESAIPGLNYKTKQTKPPQLGPMEFVTPFSKTPLLPTPQRHQAPPSSLPAAPIMNQPMSGPPTRFPEPYYMMPPHPPGMGPMAPGMPFPHLAAMRNRFPVQGPHRMMHPFNTPTSQAQIRPDMVRAPAPRPVADSTQYEEPAAEGSSSSFTQEFIIQSRSKNLDKGFSIADILQRHSGCLSFLCMACFYNTPQMINREGAEGKCSGKGKHDWSDYKILAHFSTDGSVTIINPIGFQQKKALIRVCKWKHHCRKRINAECRFAHSMVERDLWMFERDTGFSQEKIVDIANKQLGISTIPPETKSYISEITPSATLFQPPSAPTPIVISRATAQMAEAKPVARVYEEEDDICPYIVQELCLTCWKNGKKSPQDGTKDRCVKIHPNWKINRVYVVSPSNKEIRSLPRKIPKGFRFTLCNLIEKRGKCRFTGGGPCQFAHSQDELEIWQWMCAHDIKRLEDLYTASKEAQNTWSLQKNRTISGESVVTASRRATLPTVIKYCFYCGKQCNSEKQWDEHCASEKHNFNVNSHTTGMDFP